ncbi:hypothetical protein [Catellatospora sp. NPDC049609]|uniref:hypothetical protein n=1 Tax=Catellatospora sp. NPDC049609 TaxID=3155505 RepID=UPI00343AA44C
MRRIGQLGLFMAVGLAIAWALDLDVAALSHSPGYRLGAYALLAIGLYGATYGIDLGRARDDRRVITLAVTVGVGGKALLIGGSLALAWQDPLFLILGVAVAQIDPLSVAALLNDSRMSERARTVLAAWSSFDDPVTVLLAVYASAVAATAFGLGGAAGPGGGTLLWYAADLAGNAALAAACWALWRLAGDRAALRYAILAAALAAAVATGWMLAVAIIGLFARPAVLEPWIPRLTQVAMFAAATALGALLIDGVSLARGITLGVAAYAAQALAAWLLTRGMPRADRWHLAAAQQNGITAIILALTLQIDFDGVVAVVAPAIVTANLLHAGVNHLLDRRLARPAAVPAPRAADDLVPGPEELPGTGH